MDISAKITGVRYKPFLYRSLKTYDIDIINKAFSSDSTFVLKIDESVSMAISHWVSPKRTRSYPYARVYDSLNHEGKHVTVIPIMKDEGIKGDRDFLQWDTISLMSLLGVYTIISFYKDAERSERYRHKVTLQSFELGHIKAELRKLLSYQSDALHWNLEQIDNVGALGTKALASYRTISKKLKVEMHSEKLAQKRIERLLRGKETFMELSRKLAAEAQKRESQTKQPKEKLAGKKAKLTIKNYLGGNYFFTCDEARIKDDEIYLIEGKHSRSSVIPSIEDIKDGLLKMMLFTNLRAVTVRAKEYKPVSVLKLTSNDAFIVNSLTKSQLEHLTLLKREAQENNFFVFINDANLQKIDI